MNSQINIEQEKSRHSQIMAQQIAVVINHRNNEIVERLERLETRNKSINTVVGDIKSADASNPASPEILTTAIAKEADSVTVIVPPSIFGSPEINIPTIDPNRDTDSLVSTLTVLSNQLSNLEFLNG